MAVLKRTEQLERAVGVQRNRCEIENPVGRALIEHDVDAASGELLAHAVENQCRRCGILRQRRSLIISRRL